MKRMILNDKTYNVVKWVCILLLPALGTLVGMLGKIWQWSLPTQQIEDTIDAIALFLGVILGISQYNFGKKKEGE